MKPKYLSFFKKLNSLTLYNDNFDRTIRNSYQANHLLNDLIIKKIIFEEVKLYKSSAGFWVLDSRVVGVAEETKTLIYSSSWDYYL